MSFGVYKSRVVGDTTVMVRPEEHVGDDLIIVDYVPQVIGIARKAYYSINMAKSTPATK